MPGAVVYPPDPVDVLVAEAVGQVEAIGQVLHVVDDGGVAAEIDLDPVDEDLAGDEAR